MEGIAAVRPSNPDTERVANEFVNHVVENFSDAEQNRIVDVIIKEIRTRRVKRLEDLAVQREMLECSIQDLAKTSEEPRLSQQ